MKVLSVEYVPKEYDYIFSLDVDQIFVNEVTDEDLLHNDFILTKHWCNPTYASILDEVTPFISVNFKAEDYFWALGSFFGGKSKNMYELFEQSNKIHNELFNRLKCPRSTLIRKSLKMHAVLKTSVSAIYSIQIVKV